MEKTPSNLQTTAPATYPPATLGKPLGAPESRRSRQLLAASEEGRARGRARIAEQRREWASLHLRQQWADEAWMRAHLHAAGIRVADSREPASVRRLRTKLGQAGITVTEAQKAVGATLCKYLRMNPGLPLWAALALIVEACARFTPTAAKN